MSALGTILGTALAKKAIASWTNRAVVAVTTGAVTLALSEDAQRLVGVLPEKWQAIGASVIGLVLIGLRLRSEIKTALGK